MDRLIDTSIFPDPLNPHVGDCEAIDAWTAALQLRGWLPDEPEIELHPDGSGRRVGRWRLTAKGRAEWAKML
jgi:hypothetical protein